MVHSERDKLIFTLFKYISAGINLFPKFTCFQRCIYSRSDGIIYCQHIKYSVEADEYEFYSMCFRCFRPDIKQGILTSERNTVLFNREGITKCDVTFVNVFRNIIKVNMLTR